MACIYEVDLKLNGVPSFYVVSMVDITEVASRVVSCFNTIVMKRSCFEVLV